MWITGKGERYARKVMSAIRALHGKQRHQPVTIAEASAYLGIPYEDVFNIINRIKPDRPDPNSPTP